MNYTEKYRDTQVFAAVREAGGVKLGPKAQKWQARVEALPFVAAAERVGARTELSGGARSTYRDSTKFKLFENHVMMRNSKLFGFH